jgi:membrane-bound lytic murein transglycosylase MltF
MDAAAYHQCTPLMGTPYDRLACALAAYNGGIGGFRSDRRICANTAGCDPTVWFGNVEHTSAKAKRPASGYGQSFFQINRAYVRNVLITRREKYVQPMTCGKEE